ncbi:MAG: outer membrane protein transport protein [Candidatus Hydrogenedentes bacterium]|nr:outer membrane protein transport protein [Candidatus Hydrogenedentota bacterium]
MLHRLLLTLLLCGATHSVSAQGSGALGGDRSIPPTPVPVGSGARAAGMSNAFIAIADDATAASWNPAGLVQLERPEIAVAGSLTRMRDRFDATAHPEFGDLATEDFSDLNFLSFATPLPFTIFTRNATVSLSFQRKFDFDRAFEARYATGSVAALTPPLAIGQFSRLRFDQEGSLSTISPAFAIEVTHRLSVGVALNLWRSTFLSENSWTQSTHTDGLTLLGGSPILSRGISRESYEDFSGENFTAGLLWKVNPRWSLGLRYDSAFSGAADYTSFDLEARLNLASPAFTPLLNVNRFSEERRIHLPATWAVGAAWRANDRLTLALDISRTGWNGLYVKDSRGRRFSLVDGTDWSNGAQRTGFDPAWTVRLGAEYTFIPREPGLDLPRLWTLRGGLSYEEEPASNRSSRYYFSRGDGTPDVFYGASVGVGVLLGQRVNLDLAWQLRYGPDVNRDLNPGVDGFNDDEVRHRVMLSAVFYF